MDPVVLSFVDTLSIETSNRLLTAVNTAINNGVTDLTILISSPGGQLIPGFGVYNQLLGTPIELKIHNIGSVNSIANAVFLAGKKRYAAPSATFMFHGTLWGFPQGQEVPRTQISEILQSLNADENRLRDIIASKTNLSISEVADLLARALPA